jgi:hypothetical protein
VHFNLAENIGTPVPFAFMATYTSTAASGALRHLPLGEAREFQGRSKAKLLQLLDR